MSGSKTARPDAATIRFRDGGFSLVLPGTWVQIPLGDHQRAETVIADLVKRRLCRARVGVDFHRGPGAAQEDLLRQLATLRSEEKPQGRAASPADGSFFGKLRDASNAR